jgi:hypothetical protein
MLLVRGDGQNPVARVVMDHQGNVDRRRSQAARDALCTAAPSGWSPPRQIGRNGGSYFVRRHHDQRVVALDVQLALEKPCRIEISRHLPSTGPKLAPGTWWEVCRVKAGIGEQLNRARTDGAERVEDARQQRVGLASLAEDGWRKPQPLVGFRLPRRVCSRRAES